MRKTIAIAMLMFLLVVNVVSALETDKKAYALGETVNIILGNVSSDTELIVICDTGMYRYMGDLEETTLFVPRDYGEYEVKLVIGEQKIDSCEFLVNETGEPAEWDDNFELVKQVQEKIVIKEKTKKKVGVDIKVGKQFFKKQSGMTIAVTQPRVDVEFSIEEHPIKKIAFEKLDISKKTELNIDDVPENIPALRGKKWKEVFAIDPEKLDFESAILTSVAKGTELYKCAEWIFSEQRCNGTWKKIQDIVPGKQYNITISQYDPAFAETGLATINTNKSMYHIGEAAEMLMAVLDLEGYLVGNASLALNVTSPAGIITSYSTEDNSIQEIEEGIYSAGYENTSLEGNYSMTVRSKGRANYTMESYFVVKRYYEFDIIRDAPVSIDPWSGPFYSELRIVSYSSVPFTLSETVPVNLNITNSGGAQVTENEDNRVLTWSNLINRSIVGYEAQAPLVSPDLYELGKAEISHSGGLFQEARTWYIAVDPPTPHNVRGRVLHTNGSGAENGLHVSVNNTIGGDYVLTYVYAPPIPPLMGSYATTISGDDGDTIFVTAWNSSHYVRNTTTLLSTTTTMNLVLNTTRPSEIRLNITTMINQSVQNTSSSFNATFNATLIGGSSGTNCEARLSYNRSIVNISDDTVSLGDLALGENVLVSWEITALDIGFINITANASCQSDGENFDKENEKIIYNIEIEDTSPPEIVLLTPLNDSLGRQNNLTLNYNITDHTGFENCSLYLNGSLNQTNMSPDFGVNNFSVGQLIDGNHTWNVTCYDNTSGNYRGISSTFIFWVDVTPPNITLILPEENFVNDSTTVRFVYNVSDEFGFGNCSIIVDNEVIFTNKTINQSETQNKSFNLEYGNHNYSINCTDLIGNERASETRKFNISYIDLQINSSLINFSTATPVEGHNITINATIYNIGDKAAYNVTVQFFEDLPQQVQIGENISVNISGYSYETVNVTWTVQVGTFNISVLADPPLDNGTLQETNESNNEANKSIYVPLWQTFYGDVVKNIMLEESRNISVFRWLNVSNTTGNIFMVDADSSISWANLYALSRNISYNLTMDDFDEADLALNTTNRSDSLNTTFTFEGNVLKTANFTIYDNFVNDTPITNSTNSSDFVTGLLWDSSDAHFGEYDGTQDLVFVTVIEDNKPGAYGIYNYEMRIPANLRRYVEPNTQDTIMFYVEIT
ncbi:MAG: hypothetical protein GY861_06915 [bacterium]|nr:hypothetical protein [bacterium]